MKFDKSDDEVIDILREIIAGNSIRQVAQKYRLHQSTVSGWARKAGITKPMVRDWSQIKFFINSKKK